MDLKKSVNGKLLRCGYTTGSCAAAAAKAAAELLLCGKAPESVALSTPKGVTVTIDVVAASLENGCAVCTVRKDSGDDPDVTNGMPVCAAVSKIDRGVVIDGGEGVGRVTREGLDQPVGAAAINSTPRRMIEAAAAEVSQKAGYVGGLSVVISLPEGERLAKRTFNPRMGIVGGLSVIGTTGIVEPMSHQALIDTLRVQLRQAAADGHRRILITPGNYGETFADEALHLSPRFRLNCSNYIGDTIDACVEDGFTHILLVGHIGKLVKLGIGLSNTHSAFGDGRIETLVTCALEAGAEAPLLREIADCVTTDAALGLIAGAGLLEPTMTVLGARIESWLLRRVPDEVAAGYLCFTNAPGLAGVLCESRNAQALAALVCEP